MVRYYLDSIMTSYFNHHDVPPACVEDYFPQVMAMQRKLSVHGDENALKLACEHILENSDVDTEAFAGDRYPYSNQEIREIIRYAWKTLWPDANPLKPGGPPGVRLVEMPVEEWWRTSTDQQTRDPRREGR